MIDMNFVMTNEWGYKGCFLASGFCWLLGLECLGIAFEWFDLECVLSCTMVRSFSSEESRRMFLDLLCDLIEQSLVSSP